MSIYPDTRSAAEGTAAPESSGVSAPSPAPTLAPSPAPSPAPTLAPNPAPDWITRALVRRWTGRATETLEVAERRAVFGMVGGTVSVVLNLALFAVKLALGLMIGSVALLADAAHTAADSLTSIVLIAASHLARRPPDREHPFGHDRAEAIAAVVIAVLLAVAGMEFARASVLRLLHPAPVSVSWWVLGILLASAGVKEWMSRFALRLARASGNQALEADAWHHRSDVFATLLVAGGLAGARYGLDWIDGALGLAVSAFLLKVAYDVSRGAIDPLLGLAPSPEELAEIRARALSVDGVRGVHDVVVHRYGSAVFISVHIETAHHHSALALHQIAHRVEKAVARSGHGSVCVHPDPINTEHPAYGAVRACLQAAMEVDPNAEDFHDLRLVGDVEDFTVLADLRMRSGCSADETQAAAARIRARCRQQFPGTDVVLEVDPEYSY